MEARSGTGRAHRGRWRQRVPDRRRPRRRREPRGRHRPRLLPEARAPRVRGRRQLLRADALYRMSATLSPHDGGPDKVIDLTIHDIERVQRRTAPRARITIPVVMSNFDDPSAEDSGTFSSLVGESLDIGEGGCRALMPKPFPSGCDPTVTLQLPSGETVVALGADLQANVATDGRYEYRLVFLELEDLDRLRLAELIASPASA